MSILENTFPSPIILTGESYNSTRKYIVGEVVRFTTSGVSGGWILLVDAPAGTAPAANSAFWAPFPGALNEVKGDQGLPAPPAQIEYSATDTPDYTWRNTYQDNDNFRRVSYDKGTTWVIERIRGATGPKGDTPTFRQPSDGENAPLVTWQYAADPPDDATPLEWRDNYVQGDVWKHWSNDGGNTYGVPERILGRDGRDGFDLERQYSASETGPWETHDAGQDYVRERIGNIDAFGPPYRRTGGAVGTGISRAVAQEIAKAEAKARYTDNEKAEVAKIDALETLVNSLNEQVKNLEAGTASVEFAVLNWRGGKPRPPFKSETEAFAKGLLTIGIDLDGVLWTLKDTPAIDAVGAWADFDNANWDFEQNARLPESALQTGDFYYRYDEDVWVLYDGTKQIVYHDRDISAFLPNHIFLGQFSDAHAATQSIVGYDGTKTYLAYFTVTVSGRTGREVRQLQSYTPGRSEGISWVSTNETLNHLSAELHKLIQDNVDSIKAVDGVLDQIQAHLRALDTEQDTQNSAIADNKAAIDNLPDPLEKVSDDQALQGASREGYLSSRQVRLNVLAAYVKEVSDDPELDTINRRYAVLSYDATAYNADNLEFGQMMFNNATITSATKLKIGYVDEGKPTELFGGLNSNSKIELWAINKPHDYEEPFNAYESAITAVANTVRPAINAISTIELTLATPPESTVGTGPNTSYILAVSGKFRGRLAKRLIVRTWDETRDNTAIVLPADYTEYSEIDIVIRGQNQSEIPLRYPTAALTDPRRDNSDGDISQLGTDRNNRVSFNRSSRTLSAAGNRVIGFTYVELWT